MKIAACIILYHPNLSDLEKDIRAICYHIDTLILWRNSPEEIVIPQDLLSNIIWMGNGDNRYISYALNRCLDYCDKNGFDYLLSMDQDSEFEDFSGFLSKVSALQFESSFEKTIVFAPNVNHRYHVSPSMITVESTITSGSLCKVREAIAIGGFRESYQIYWVDSEFCHRANLNGYRILTLTEYNLIQQFGKKTISHGITCYNYSAQSYYFLFRNMFWMHREYKMNPSIKCILYTTKMYIKSIIFGEANKWAKIKAVLRGIRHGITRNYQ